MTQGLGRLVSTPCNAEYVYGRVKARDQARQPVAVDREAYAGPVTEVQEAAIMKTVDKPIMSQQEPDFHQRAPTRGGGRNMQDSSFSLSGQ